MFDFETIDKDINSIKFEGTPKKKESVRLNNLGADQKRLSTTNLQDQESLNQSQNQSGEFQKMTLDDFCLMYDDTRIDLTMRMLAGEKLSDKDQTMLQMINEVLDTMAPRTRDPEHLKIMHIMHNMKAMDQARYLKKYGKD